MAPRAPTNTWMLWHEDFIDDLFDELIKIAIIMEDVNPAKIYLLGYSAGGDGVFQLATRMADRWAAAAMMAQYARKYHSDKVLPKDELRGNRVRYHKATMSHRIPFVALKACMFLLKMILIVAEPSAQ